MKREKQTKETTNNGEANATAIEKRPNGGTVNVPDRIERPATYYVPLVDVAESAAAFLFQADLPGVKAGDVDVTCANGTLTIQGRVRPRQPAGQRYVWQEYGVGHFYRSFDIKTPIDVDGIRAEMKSGVLELYVPKAESARPRKIEVKAS